MAKTFDYDIVIVGAGMVGVSLAIGLAPTRLRIAMIESNSFNNSRQGNYDDRGISLSPASKRIYQNLGVWRQIQGGDCYPIKNIHVSEQGRFGFIKLAAEEFGCQELGHVVVAKSLGRALLENLKQHNNITLLCPAELKSFELIRGEMRVTWRQHDEETTINAGLLVGADGSHSLVRRLAGIKTEYRDFKQTAIVANINTQKPNQETAFERFTPNGPIALLPMGKNRSIMTYVVASDQAQVCLIMQDKHFIERVQHELGRRLGQIERLGRRRNYPLFFQLAVTQYKPQLVLLGNSAHTIHPNAAQGFNLCLRDAAGLVGAINNSVNHGIGIDDINILNQYVAARAADQRRIIRLSNSIARIFYNRWPGISAGRNALMLLVDILPFLKRRFFEVPMGLTGAQPELVRGVLE